MVEQGWNKDCIVKLSCAIPQAWRAVDRAYVDKSFNGQSWFRVRVQAAAVEIPACLLCLPAGVPTF
jgi:hypothetical protein